MRSLETTLRDYDLDLLRVIARRWDIDLPGGNARAAAAHLAALMSEPDRAEATWELIDDQERGALQTLHASGGRMTTAQFSRIFGAVREMGPARRKKETPYLNPENVAERLFYRGLIATGFDQNVAGVIQEYTYIPAELGEALPFTTSEALEDTAPGQPADVPDAPRPVDTSVVDDVVTFLAYVNLAEIEDALHGADIAAMRPHLLGGASASRLTFLMNLARGSELALAGEDGVLRLARVAVRTWLEAERSVQLRALIAAWSEGTYYNDLHHVPVLVYEEGGGQNDPILARQGVFNFLAMLPPGVWWSLDSFVEAIKEEAPDFQRPTGEWDSWYIRDAETGDYLHGFESWDRVDGALIRYLITGPMYWLGLTQIDALDETFRLTEPGMALMGLLPWEQAAPPSVDQAAPLLDVRADGTVIVSRDLNRFDRFQLARVADWESATETAYTYRLTAGSLRRANTRGIQVKHILATLSRLSEDEVPASLVKALERWESTGGMVTLSRAVIMRTDSPEELERLRDEPGINRFLGRPLGSTAIEVRPGMWPELRAALQAVGVLPEVVGLDDD